MFGSSFFFFCFPSSTQNFLFRVKFDEILFFSPSRNSRIFYLVIIWNTDFLLIGDNKNSKTRFLDFFHPDLSNSKFSQQRFRYRLNFGNSIIKLQDIRFRFFRKNFSSPIPIIFSPLKSRTRKCTWNGSYICNTRFRFRWRQWAERLTRRISTFSRLTRLRAFDSNAFGIRSRRNTEKRIR